MNKFLTMPTDFVKDNKTTLKDKLLLCEVHNLSSLEKGCIASNSHFEKLLGFSKKSVSNSISKMVKDGILEVKISDRNQTRIIKIIDESVLDLLSTKSGGVSTKSGGVSTKSGESKENNTINNTVNNNLMSFWNDFADANSKQKVLKLTDKRVKKIALRNRELNDLDGAFKMALEKAKRSAFLLESKFFTFDWIIENDTNIVKVIEGNYSDSDEKGWK